MNFHSFESIRSAVGGTWIVEPEADAQIPDSVAIDTRGSLAGALFVAIVGERHDGHTYLFNAVEGGARAMLVERARLLEPYPQTVPLIAVDDTVQALAQLAQAWREELTAEVIGITGSAGKTTMRRLLAPIFEAVGPTHASPGSFNNHLGVPLTILGAPRETRFLLVEIGTNAPGEIEALGRLARPHSAVITNVARAHLEGLGSIEAIAREKASLLKCLPEDGIAVFPVNNKHLDQVLAEFLPASLRTVTFGSGEGDVALAERSVLGPTGDQSVRLEDGLELRIHLPGEHNATNACGAVALARALGITDDVIATGLASVEPDPMRLAPLLMEDTGTMILNDVYNANPEAVLSALDTFAEISNDAARRIVILGDMLELGPDENTMHAEMGQAVANLAERVPIDVAIFIGERSVHGSNALAKAGFNGLIVRVPAPDDLLLDSVAAIVQPGDAMLVKASRGMALERLVDAVQAQNAVPEGQLARG